MRPQAESDAGPTITMHFLATAALWLALSSCSLFRPRPPVYDPVYTASGLTLRDLVVPDQGELVQPGDTVTIEYLLRLEDGTKIDSTEDRGRPVTFQQGAGQVPAGLDEGLLGMCLFGRRRIIIPPELGYGAEGMPPDIPPHATLVFDVELIELEGAVAEASGEPADP